MATRKLLIVDTTFACFDMGRAVIDRLNELDVARSLEVSRVVVPGFKDLTAVCRRASDDGAEIVVACGMPGPEPIDEACATDASRGLQMVQAMTGTPILEVFVHMSEALVDGAVDYDMLSRICELRCLGHAENAFRMILEPDEMTKRAGTGRRQGGHDLGPVGAMSTNRLS